MYGSSYDGFDREKSVAAIAPATAYAIRVSRIMGVMVSERQMSGQELVWEAVRLLDLPEDRDYEVIALRPEI